MKALNNVTKVAKVVVKNMPVCLGALALGSVIADRRLIEKQRKTIDMMYEVIDEKNKLLSTSLKQTEDLIDLCDKAQQIAKTSIGQTDELLNMFETKDTCYLEDEEDDETAEFDQLLESLKED